MTSIIETLKCTNMDDYIKVKKSRYANLLCDSALLFALYECGLEDWAGYDLALADRVFRTADGEEINYMKLQSLSDDDIIKSEIINGNL